MELTPAIVEPPTLPPPPQFSDLVRATQFGRYEECRQYLETNLFDVNQRDPENVTLLHWAAINNQTGIVDYFLDKGADINAIGGGPQINSSSMGDQTRTFSNGGATSQKRCRL